MNKALAQEITDILASAAQPVAAAYAFGSVVAGCATASSDIDMAILCPGLDAAEKMRLWEAIAGVTERPVDWVDLNNAGPVIMLEALKGLCLIGSREQHAQLLSRALIDGADFGYLHSRLLKERRDAWLD